MNIPKTINKYHLPNYIQKKTYSYINIQSQTQQRLYKIIMSIFNKNLSSFIDEHQTCFQDIQYNQKVHINYQINNTDLQKIFIKLQNKIVGQITSRNRIIQSIIQKYQQQYQFQTLSKINSSLINNSTFDMNTKYKLGSASQENQVNNKQKKIRVINLPQKKSRYDKQDKKNFIYNIEQNMISSNPLRPIKIKTVSIAMKNNPQSQAQSLILQPYRATKAPFSLLRKNFYKVKRQRLNERVITSQQRLITEGNKSFAESYYAKAFYNFPIENPCSKDNNESQQQYGDLKKSEEFELIRIQDKKTRRIRTALSISKIEHIFHSKPYNKKQVSAD